MSLEQELQIARQAKSICLKKRDFETYKYWLREVVRLQMEIERIAALAPTRTRAALNPQSI